MNNFQAQIKHKNTDFVPVLSVEAIDFHYEKHHCGYAKTLNSLIENTQFADQTLEKTIVNSRGIDQKIFNNAAQLFNHNFYWECLGLSKNQPIEKLKHMIECQFNSFDEFLNQYISFANTMFGSGWSWLVIENDKLSFVNTQNAETVIGTNQNAICVIDLWEHAYYIDYRNDRALYINNIVKECINWKFCESQLDEK